MLRGPGCSTVREDREDQGRPESSHPPHHHPGPLGQLTLLTCADPQKLGPRCEVLMAASGQDSLPRDQECAEIPAAPGGSSLGRLRTSSAPTSRIPPGTWLRPQSFFICAHPLSLEPLQPPPCLLHSQPAVSALPRASALGQSPRWLLLLRACPCRARSHLDRAARRLWKRWAGNPPSPRVPAGSEDLTSSAGSLRVCTPPAPAPRVHFRRCVLLRVPAPPRRGLRRCPTLSGHAPRVGSTSQSPGARAGAEPGLPTLRAGVPGKRAEHPRLEWAGSKWPPPAEPRPRAQNRAEHFVEMRSLSVPQMQFVLPNRAVAGHFGEEPALAGAVSAGQDRDQRQQQEQELIPPGGCSKVTLCNQQRLWR
uniref:Uncharacterized protein n=1 Tax=Mustela putorius furo TaxID=9669 RepID=M3Y9G8_MUSPF